MPKGTFAVTARGVGRKDYTKTIERSTQPFITPSLRQTEISAYASFTLAVLPFPSIWVWLMPLPQEDGTWYWLASSIVVHFFELHVSLRTNHLVTIGLARYASIADYLAGHITERGPQIFSYSKADLSLSKGIPTQEGSLYALLATGWPDTPTMEITVMATGIVTELTAPWME